MACRTKNAFVELKQAVCSAEALGFPTDNSEDIFLAATDASRIASGGCLSQIQTMQDGSRKEILIVFTRRA